MAAARLVAIDDAVIRRAAEDWSSQPLAAETWDTEGHFADGGPLTAQYLLVVDALNFCFWPDPNWQYARLAESLRDALILDPAAFDAGRLAALTPSELCRWLGGLELPQMEERVRLLREVGTALDLHFGGQAAQLIAAAGESAGGLVALLAAHLPGFRDHAIHAGRQVFFYKRAQIFAGDVWGAFGGRGLGKFNDITALTMFADYRVPQLLRELGIIRYVPDLAARIDARVEIPAGSAEEVEIRAATVQAVERLRGQLGAEGRNLAAIQVDWILWHQAEAMRDRMAPHHCTLTIYY